MPKLKSLRILNCLAEKGFGSDPLREMQRIIDAEKIDMNDVLAYVAFALSLETRAERAKDHKAVMYRHKQKAFLAFFAGTVRDQRCRRTRRWQAHPTAEAALQQRAA
jgi:hypothetical protein